MTVLHRPNAGAPEVPLEPESAAPRRTSWWRVACAVGAGFAVAFNIGKVPAALPALRLDLGLSLFQAGSVVALFSLLAAAIGILMGAVSERFGSYRAALAGLALAAAGSMLGSLAGSLSSLILARSMEGLGFILAAVALPPLIVSCATERARPVALGIWGAFVPGGMGLMLVASPYLMAAGGWRNLWQATAIAIVLAGIALAIGLREQFAPQRAVSAWSNVRGMLVQAGPLRMAGCFGAYSAQFIAVTSFLPTVLIERHALPVAAAALLCALVVMSNVIGNVASGWLLRAGVGRQVLLVIAAAVMGLSTVAIFADATPLAVRYAAALAFASVGGLIPGTLFATAPVFASEPARIAVISGMMLQGSGLGQVTGPLILTAAVGALGSWSYASVVTLAAAILCAVFAMGLRAR